MKALIAILLGTSPIMLHLAIVSSSRPLMALFLALITASLLLGAVRGTFPPWGIAVFALGVGGLALLDLDSATRVAGAWPVLVYLAIAWVFGRSLRTGRIPLVERFARIIDHGDTMSSELVAYTRFLTWAWTAVPLSLALASVLLAQFASREVWSLFTNVLGYLTLATLFFAEYPYRRWRYPDTPHTNPVEVAVRLARRAPELLGRQDRHPG